MAQKLYELALEIQGKLDSSFSGAMKSAQGDLKALESDMKAWNDRQKDVTGADAAYVKAREGARQLGSELAKLKGHQQAVSDYQAQRKATTETARAYRNVQREVKALTAAYAKDKTPANKKAMQEAAKQAKALEKEYNKNKTTLMKMGEKLKGAGIDTKNLSSEQATLARKIADATKEQERYNRAAERVTRHKAFWADLTGKVREYSSYAMSAVKWTAGIGATLATSAYMITKSTAEAGDKAQKLADAIGADVTELQKLNFVADESNVKDFNLLMTTMTKNFSAAAVQLNAGGKTAQTALKDKKAWYNILRIDPTRQRGLADTLGLIAERIKGLDEKARNNVLGQIFGSKQVNSAYIMLKDGVKGIEEGMKEAEKTGKILTEDTTRFSETFMNDINRLQSSVVGLKNTIGAELMPVVDDIVKEITAWVQQNRELVSEEVKDWVLWLKENLPYAWEEFKKGTSAIGDFLGVIGSGIETLGGFSTTLKALLGLWTAKKVYGMVSWIGGAAGSLLPAAAAGTATAAGTTAAATTAGAAGPATAAGTAAAGMAAKGTAAGTGASLLGTIVPWASLALLYNEALQRSKAVERTNKVGETLGIKNGFIATEVEWAEASKKLDKDALAKGQWKVTETPQKAPSIDPLEAMYPELAKLRAKQALPQHQAAAKTTPPSAKKDTVSPLPDEQVKPVWDIVSIAKGISEQNKQRVSREDYERWGDKLALAIKGNEQAIRELPERLRFFAETQRATAQTQPPIVEHHARGGFVSTPTISTLAERGGEMVIPTADADRGLGISRLMEAARKLNVPVVPTKETGMGRDINLDALMDGVKKLTATAPQISIPLMPANKPDIGRDFNLDALLDGVKELTATAPQINIPVMPAKEPDMGRNFNFDTLLGDMKKMAIPTPLDNASDNAPDNRWDLSRPFKPAREITADRPNTPMSMPNINLSQTFTITGTDAQDIVEQVGSISKQAVIEAMQEYQAEMRRVDYAT